MAINPCKECGGPVSDKAEICPFCGAKKPKQTSLITWLCLGLLGIAFFIWIYSDTNKVVHENSTASIANSNESKNQESINWHYTSSKDEMRGSTMLAASTISLNKVDFGFPYQGGSELILSLRKIDNNEDVIVTISEGQILCSLRSCEIAFKFDDGPVESISMVEPDNYSSKTLFVKNDETRSSLIKKLKSGQKLIIEVPFYKEGREQFTFDISKLNWN